MHITELDDDHVMNHFAIVLQKMKRYGPSLKSLKLVDDNEDREDDIDWIDEIGDAFPNLQSLGLSLTQIRSESLSVLPVKCGQLTRITLECCDVTDGDLGIILKGFPELNYLKLDTLVDVYGKCFRELGTNIEHLRLNCIMMTPAASSHILSRCRNLQTLKIELCFQCRARRFAKFCEESPLRELEMYELQLSKQVLFQISSLYLLEKLILMECPAVDSGVLFGISRGCPYLKYVRLGGLPLVCDRGVTCFTRCRHLENFQCIFLGTVTDESLFEMARIGSYFLKALVIASSEITDRGLACILKHRHYLKYLDVKYCENIGDSLVDVAIETVESRHADALDDETNESTAIVPTHKSSDYLLKLRMEGDQLDRYKDGFSHPLLCLQLD